MEVLLNGSTEKTLKKGRETKREEDTKGGTVKDKEKKGVKVQKKKTQTERAFRDERKYTIP